MASYDPTLFILLGCLFGLLIGGLTTLLLTRRRIFKAFEEGKAESEAEREEASVEIEGQLAVMRDGLIQTIKAYEGATRAVNEKLRPAGSTAQRLDALQQAAAMIEHETSAVEVESVELDAVESESIEVEEAQEEAPEVEDAEEPLQFRKR